MSNSYFAFKQFRIEQGRTAMKVSTDACIQGAWTPVNAHHQYILDIGAGTGLLAMMLAQRQPDAVVDAIELDEQASLDALQNIAQSPFASRLRLFTADVRKAIFDRQYDLIVCNPPFFTRSLLGPESKRNQARHDIHFSQQDLLNALAKHLNPQGQASVLLPVKEHASWAELLHRNGWLMQQQLEIRPRVGAAPNRIVSLCSRHSSGNTAIQTLDIRNEDNAYTEAFIRLMAPFYLHV